MLQMISKSCGTTPVFTWILIKFHKNSCVITGVIRQDIDIIDMKDFVNIDGRSRFNLHASFFQKFFNLFLYQKLVYIYTVHPAKHRTNKEPSFKMKVWVAPLRYHPCADVDWNSCELYALFPFFPFTFLFVFSRIFLAYIR